MRAVALTLLLGLAVSSCAPKTQVASPRMRTLSPDGPSHYHQAVQLQVAWHPYREHELVATGDAVYSAQSATRKEGSMPVLVVSYPDSAQTLSLRMDIDDALLGRLLKHTLMTQKPIVAPLSQYLEEADCAMCHPADVPTD